MPTIYTQLSREEKIAELIKMSKRSLEFNFRLFCTILCEATCVNLFLIEIQSHMYNICGSFHVRRPFLYIVINI